MAVTLTKTGSDFDTYLNAGGKISACGSVATIGGVAKPYGGAGTVYLRLPGQGLYEGTLVIDNGGATKSPSHTLISSLVQDAEVGSVQLKGNAALAIDEGVDLTVSKDWTGEAGTAVVDLQLHGTGQDARVWLRRGRSLQGAFDGLAQSEGR